MTNQPSAVFAYGTLKKGQCRETCWPLDPQSIRPGWVHADLFDREDYPALKRGESRVAGQIWAFMPDDMEKVLESLDKVEGLSDGGSPGLYERDVVEVFGDDGSVIGHAFVYFYASDPNEDGFEPMEPGDDGFIHWRE